MSLAEGINLASGVVQELLRHGLVKLYRCCEGYLMSESQLQEIDEADWDRVLSSRDSWQVPAVGSVSIRFETTPAGEAALFGEPA